MAAGRGRSRQRLRHRGLVANENAVSDGRTIWITHRPSGEVLAEGPLGWDITPFEGNYYIRRRCMKTRGFKVNFIPGLCFYEFLYVWLDFSWPGGRTSNLGWLYWLPSPLFPFRLRLGPVGIHMKSL